MKRPDVSGAQIAGSLLVMGLAIGAALAIRTWGLGLASSVLALSIGVVVVAARVGLAAGMASSVLAVLAFNFLFTEPLYTLLVDDPREYLVFALLLAEGSLVGSLTDRLAARTREAQAALLLQGLSHDGRTPLAVIAGTAATLRDTAASRLDAGERDRLTTIEAEARHLSRQVDTMLTLVELEGGGTATFSWVPAEDLFHSCRDRFAEWRPERVVRWEPVLGVPLVRVEPTLLERALLNLLENADRWSPPDAPIDLVLALTPREVEFQVLDRGPGVPDADKHRIFEKFTRGSVPGYSRRGVGLGLALVSQTARLHGGKAGVRDRDGGGSVFWLRVPVPEGAPGFEVPE